MNYYSAVAAVVFCLFTGQEASAWCLWGAVKGTRLGYIGDGRGVPNGATTASGRTSLDTQSTQGALFFGYVGNEIKIFRDNRMVAHCGNYKLEPKHGRGYTTRNAIDGSVTYQPGWLLLQSPLVTRIYACQPHGKGHFRMAGGQGAMWSTEAEPVVNEVRAYESVWVDWQATGYGVLVAGNQNFVSLIKMDELWPCEMIADFATAAGAMAIKSNDDYKRVDIRWGSKWPCNYSAGEANAETGILFTVRGEAVPPEAGSVSGVGTYHTGRTAQIFARPNEGYEFDRWEGGYASSPAAFGLAVLENTSLVARFKARKIAVSLGVSAAGSNGNRAWAEGAIFANGREVGRTRVASGSGQAAVSEGLRVMVPYNAKVWFEGRGGVERGGGGEDSGNDEANPRYEASGGGKSFRGEGAFREDKLGQTVAEEPVSLGAWSVRAAN